MAYRNTGIDLSPEQTAAVEYIGPALVVAGAGSGKTRTLTAKIAYLIDHGYSPECILAITFTNKAAGEMKSRLVDLTGLSIDRFPWVRTFHSACFKILKQHCHILGYETPLQIYSEYQQQKIVKEILVKLNIDKKYLYPIRSHLSNAKNSGNPGSYFDAQRRMAYGNLHEIFDLYEKELLLKNAVDFDNILLVTRNLLRDHPEIQRQYQSMFSYLLVDEYQDTNNLQEDLTRLLLGSGNLFCVGDDWQAIYGFRGSNVDHFIQFVENYESARIFRLEQNYRSAEEIVQAANELIRFNKNRVDKDCYSRKNGGSIEVHDFYSDEEEAGWVVRKIELLNDAGIKYENMAVLYRTKFCSLSFEKAFRSAGIPYKMLGAKGFFERKEILDITCYLTAAVFEKDDVALERVLNTPKRGIGPGTLNKINQMRTGEMSLQDAVRKALEEKVLPEKVYKALKSLLNLLDDIKTMLPDAAIREVLERSNYLDYLQKYSKSSGDYTTREENLDQLIYSSSQYSTLLEYLEDASLVKEDKDEGDDLETGVSLSTMHASKGLEFYTVFVVGCEENLLPHWKSKESEAEIQEERRLMYVAMTRAEQYLYISSAGYRKGQFNPTSRFIAELSNSSYVL
ncbi:MAG: UvrD-helicase domain-containing protein [Desulfobacteraceae bacterium]|nr:UvrD-helicase domain-containing protein [Desulfobacteraceae bacterium]MBC2755905.1 UvrD-helicase domain-containing protein [Desulfobacteraceae bacterium]